MTQATLPRRTRVDCARAIALLAVGRRYRPMVSVLCIGKNVTAGCSTRHTQRKNVCQLVRM